MRIHLTIVVSFLLALSGCRHESPSARVVRRVVTLAPNVTEIVYALGAGEQIVGTDDSSDFPPAARRLPKVGGLPPNLEKIVALRPDLVIANAAGLHPNLSRSLAAVHVPLLVVTNERLRDVPLAMQRIGAALGRHDVARAIAALDRALAAQRRVRAHRPRVMFAVWTDPLYVGGRDTFAGDLFDLCGARNAVDVTGWPQYSLESFVANPPDLLLYPNRSVTPDQVRKLLERAHVANVEAVAVDEDIFTRPGPRIPQAAAMLNVILDRFAGERR